MRSNAVLKASPMGEADASPFNPPLLQHRHGQGCRPAARRGVVGGASKRAFDIVMAGGALVVLSPFLVGVWALVRIESPGPGLFLQRRGGFQGRPFYILKFRTMKTQESRQITQARDGDDRTTKLGRILRKLSIDELPQLVNVLLGDMSIVGPRPHALAHDRQFMTMDRRYQLRYRARPGITGLAQVSGARGLTDTPEKVAERLKFDISYVSNWSMLGDWSIIVRTALMLIKDRSAF